MLVLTCPNCTAHLEIDESRDFAFCQYCGTKITNLNNNVEINRTTEIRNLLLRAEDFAKRGLYEKSMEYCERVLDLDPHNQTARDLEKRLPCYSAGPNLTIVYKSVHNDRFKLRFTFDGRNWTTLSNNEQSSIELPVGKYRILFSGKKNYSYDLSITDINKRTTVVYTANKFKNTIEQFDL